jgi:hypothetical protein
VPEYEILKCDLSIADLVLLFLLLEDDFYKEISFV